jgi:hypothetical protein
VSSVRASWSSAHPRPICRIGDAVETFIRREDAEHFVEEVRGDEPELASYLRIEERELEAGGWTEAARSAEAAVGNYSASHQFSAFQVLFQGRNTKFRTDVSYAAGKMDW